MGEVSEYEQIKTMCKFSPYKRWKLVLFDNLLSHFFNL